MTDDLEARAREFVTKSWPYKGTTDVKVRAALAWARLLVAESRAGAREVLRRIAVEASSLGDADGILYRIENWATDALAAESEPGAQDREGKEGKE